MEQGTYARQELPASLQTLLDPAAPLGTMADRYFPRFDKKNNMIMLCAGVWVMLIGFMLFASVFGGKNAYPLPVLVALALMGVLVLGWANLKKRRADRVGGDLHRCGVYMLEDGILVADEETALWLPRAAVTGFEPDHVLKEERESFAYVPLTGEERHALCRLDSMTPVREQHEAQLDAWRENGVFSVDDWRYGRMPS